MKNQSTTAISLILFIAVLKFFYGCSSETDIDVTAAWKEIPVVYGLLNTADSVQYIKINKAFLGDGNALKMAQVADSVNYGNELDVKLQKLDGGNLIPLIRDTSIQKTSGTFASSPNVLYKTNEKITGNGKYKLSVINTKSGKQISSVTLVVSGFSVNYPDPSSTTQISWAGQIPYKVQWTSAKNGRLYNFIIRFNYIEIDKNTGSSVPRFLEWVFPNVKSAGTDGGEAMEYEIKKVNFYKHLAAHIKPDNVIRRVAKDLDFVFTVGSDELNTYIELNQPATGIVQEKPFYTNIEGGAGLFSSRLTYRIEGKRMTQQSLDSLSFGYYTKQLGFCNFDFADSGSTKCN